MRTQRKRRQAGYTLIEAAIASVILILALVSVLALAARGFRYLSDMRQWARSSQVLQQKMEDIRLVTVWTNVWALNNTAFRDSTITGEIYSGSVVISAYNPPYPTDFVACVTLTVTWTNRNDRVLTNRLSTLLCKNGLSKYIF